MNSLSQQKSRKPTKSGKQNEFMPNLTSSNQQDLRQPYSYNSSAGTSIDSNPNLGGGHSNMRGYAQKWNQPNYSGVEAMDTDASRNANLNYTATKPNESYKSNPQEQHLPGHYTRDPNLSSTYQGRNYYNHYQGNNAALPDKFKTQNYAGASNPPTASMSAPYNNAPISNAYGKENQQYATSKGYNVPTNTKQNSLDDSEDRIRNLLGRSQKPPTSLSQNNLYNPNERSSIHSGQQMTQMQNLHSTPQTMSSQKLACSYCNLEMRDIKELNTHMEKVHDHVPHQQQLQNYSSSPYVNKNSAIKPVSYGDAAAQWKNPNYGPPAPGTPDTNNPNKVQSDRNLTDIEQYIKNSLSTPEEDKGGKTNKSEEFIKLIQSAQGWPISCYTCGSKIFDVSAFDKHMDDHWKKERACPICGAQTMIGFEDHYRSHAKLRNELRQIDRRILQKQEEQKAAIAKRVTEQTSVQISGVSGMRLEPVSIDWNNLGKNRKGNDTGTGNADVNNNINSVLMPNLSFDELVKSYYDEAEVVVDEHGDRCMANKETCNKRKRAKSVVQKIEKESRDVFQSVQQSYIDLWDHSFGHYCFQEQWNAYSKSRFNYTPYQSIDSKAKMSSMTGRVATKRPLGAL